MKLLSCQKKIKIIFLVIFIFNFVNFVYSKENAPIKDYYYSYDGEYIGARALGMGGAYVAVADTPDAVYYNPAGLYNVKNKELGLMFDMGRKGKESDYDVKSNDAVRGSSLRYAVFCQEGGALSWRPLADYRNTNSNGDNVELNINQYSISASSKSDEGGIAGINLNYMRGYLGYLSNTDKTMNLSKGSGWGLDWGFLFDRNKFFTIGVMLKNAPAFIYWQDYKSYQLPFTLLTGFSSTFPTKTIFSFEYERRYYRNIDSITAYHLGLEQAIISGIYLRIGTYGENLKDDDKVRYTSGFGFAIDKYRFDIATEKYKLDKDGKNIYHTVGSISMLF
jgi:hypothetical protein